jgi:hypothetical protein
MLSYPVEDRPMQSGYVKTTPSPVSEEQKDAHAPKDRYNLEDAFIVIDGKRYNVKDLLKLVVEQLATKKP